MSLSDKRGEWTDEGWEQTKSFGFGAMKFYKEEDVKEAIRKLKEEISEEILFDAINKKQYIIYEINKIFGDKLS